MTSANPNTTTFHWSSLRNLDFITGLLVATVAAGVVLRAWTYFSGHSLWLDEAMVAVSILERDWQQLREPLAYMQVAPIGWLYIERAFVLAFGDSELALRLPAFLMGLAALLAFASFARRAFGTEAALLATALFAFSSQLVRYSAELKPYGVDVLVSVLLLFFTLRHLKDGALLKGRDYAALLGVGVLGVIMSLPAAFVLAGLGGALWLREALARRWRSAIALAGVAAAWLSVFIWHVAPIIRPDTSNLGVMRQAWTGAFAPFPPDSFADIAWYAKTMLDNVKFYFGPLSAIAVATVIALGGILTLRKNALLAFALLAPLAIVLVVSMLRLYAVSDRLMAFAIPQFIVLAAIALDQIMSSVKLRREATALAAALLLAGSASDLGKEFLGDSRPFALEDLRPVLNSIVERGGGSSPLFINGGGVPAFERYAPRAGLSGDVIAGRMGMSAPLECALTQIEQIVREPQIWVIFSHPETVAPLQVLESTYFTSVADVVGERLDEISVRGVQAYHYSFDERAPAKVATLRELLGPTYECPAEDWRDLNAERQSATAPVGH